VTPRLPEPYTFEKFGGAMVAALPDAAIAVRAALERHATLYDAAAAGALAPPMHGRGPVYLIDLGGRTAVVRHCHRGGAIARLSRDRYLRIGEPRPFYEIRASAEALRRGVPTPTVLAAVVHRGTLRYRADVATEHIPNSVDLAELLFGEPQAPVEEMESAAYRAGALIRLAHERGVLHTDLNLKNVLLQRVDDDWKGWLLDFDQCRVVDSTNAKQRARMLMRLQRSRHKWERKTGKTVSPAVRSAFRAGYAIDPELPRRA
jgi:3-deoxy-D-manno-octulosonic acid kinase